MEIAANEDGKNLENFELNQTRYQLVQLKRRFEKDPGTTKFLDEKGYMTGRGKGMSTLFLQSLADELKAKEKAVKRTVEDGRIVEDVINGIGEGSLPILPREFHQR